MKVRKLIANVIYPDGRTKRLNTALISSCDIDSNGNGIPNRTSPAPIPSFTPGRPALTSAICNGANLSMESALSDEFLLLQARHGDHLAFSQLVAKYKLSIISFAARILGDPIEAEDVAQAVFIKVFIASQGFRFAAKFRTWLMAIARNLCLNELRRRMRHNADPARRYGELYEWVRCQDRNEACRTPSELISEQEFHSKIEAAIGELPDQQRTAILLLKEYEMAYEEIASVLKLTPSATKSLVHRARQALKNKLRPYLSGEARWASRVAGRNRARK